MTYTVLVEGETPEFSAVVPVEADIRFQTAPTPVLDQQLLGKILKIWSATPVPLILQVFYRPKRRR